MTDEMHQMSDRMTDERLAWFVRIYAEHDAGVAAPAAVEILGALVVERAEVERLRGYLRDERRSVTPALSQKVLKERIRCELEILLERDDLEILTYESNPLRNQTLTFGGRILDSEDLGHEVTLTFKNKT